MGTFNKLLSTQNVNVARFARYVECDFLGDFQTLCKGQKGRRRKAINSLENVIGPKEIIVHGGYRSVGFVNDIAIINLHQPLKLMEKPISSIKWALKPPSESEKCMVAGWGSTSRDTKNSKSYPYKLHEASVLMRNFAQCRVNYFLVMAKKFKVIEYSPAELKKAKDLWFYVQHRQNICAGNGKTDSCAADSGGPMICKDPDTNEYVLSGIVSWGLGCAKKQYPGVYSNVAYFKYWIQEQVKMVRFRICKFMRPQCLKISQKVSFNSEASYVYILSGQKFIKNAKNGQFWRVLENLRLAVKQCYQTGQFRFDKNRWKPK